MPEDAENAGGNPNATIENGDKSADVSKTLNLSNTKKGSTRSKRSNTSDLGSKLQMPSQQAGRFTTAINKIKNLQDQRSVAGVVHGLIKEAETQLGILQEQLENVLPEDDTQRLFKQSWIAKNVAPKITYLREAKQALQADLQQQHEDRHSRASTTSSARRAAAEAAALAAAEEEERLLQLESRLKEEQLAKQRQREAQQALEQQERSLLKQKIAEAKTRREELERRAEMSSIALSIDFPLHVPRLRRDQSPLPQPTPEWLLASRTAAREHQEPHQEAHLLQHLLLSQASVPVFKGDPLEYLWFCKSFETQVEAVTTDPNRLLHMLMQKLEGEPYTLVKGCQLASSAAVGFQRAKQLLHTRYGNPVRQALAFKTKLLQWPTVKKAADLTGFSIQLQLCQEVKDNAGRLSELDAASTLLQLASKLPHKLQFAWQTKVVDIEVQQMREASFEDFVKFVVRHEQARNHPVFGRLATEKDEENKGASKAKVFQAATKELEETSAQSPQPTLSLATTNAADATKTGTKPKAIKEAAKSDSKENPKNAFVSPCLICKQDHPTSKCKPFDMPREERREKLRSLCYSCLKPGHSAKFCKFRLKCDVCSGLHPTCLHDPKLLPKETEKKETLAEQATNLSTAVQTPSTRYLVATAPVKIWAPGSQSPIIVRALLDPGSNTTFVTAALAKRLGAATKPITLSLTTLGHDEQPMTTNAVFGLKIADVDGNEPLDVGVAYTVANIPSGGPAFTSEMLLQWPHLEGLHFHEEAAEESPSMLIGLNVPDAVIPVETKKGRQGEPFATRTALGWALQGPLDTRIGGKVIANCLTVEVNEALNRLYYQDFKDAFDFTTKGPSRDDNHWLQQVKGSISHHADGHYYVDLPFKPGMLERLQDNRTQALQRLRSVGRRFKTSPQFQVDYVAFMEKMIRAGHVEPVEPELDDEAQATINYVVHHGVYHPRKPGKIRVVFNCASKFRDVSLNDCLLSGPDLTNSLVGVLIRFRQYQVAFMADIEAMFYQVMVPPQQRNILRFLWWKGEGGELKEDCIQTYRLKVHLFGATSSPSVANFALRRSAEDAFAAGQITEDAKTSVFKNFYVDDCLKSLPSEEEGRKMALDLITACRHGGFRLGKFTSTSLHILKSLNSDHLATNLNSVDLSDDKTDPLGSLQERALGLAWSVKEDELKFTLPSKDDYCGKRATKREVLSKLSRLYDPLGFAAPIIVKARILFREIVKDGQDWDAEVDAKIDHEWKEWSKELENLSSTAIPRWMGPGGPKEEWQLHVFSDASTQAYAAVVYIARQGQVAFVVGKARVTPPKVITIPRLELVAAKLAADMAHMVQAELELPTTKKVMWTDSQAVLKYINNQDKRFPIFVANRVQAILSLTKASEWRFVPTALNPADDGTRGLTSAALAKSAWLQGPKFLQEGEECWPRYMQEEQTKEESAEAAIEETVVQTLATDTDQHTPFVEEVALRYSSTWRFGRAMAAWMRVKGHLHTRLPMKRGPFTVPEVEAASRAALRWLQWQVWPVEVLQLEQGNPVKLTSPLHQLSPLLEDGLVIVGSRVHVNVPIVPYGHFGRLLVRSAHRAHGHLGRSATAAAVRRSWWVMGLNKLVRHEVRSCPLCQLRRAVPKETQMSVLPECRLQEGPPFTTVGVDYFGPFYVRQEKSKKRKKAYGVIFTCATSRAVHLEVAESLTTSSFVNALRRFISRRGMVRHIFSDNGTNFVGAESDLKVELEKLLQSNATQEEVDQTVRAKGISWTFNPPGASHFGGFYERLIRSVREILEALIIDALRPVMTTEVLVTFLCEVESILNARPLTTVSDDPADFEALTPNHLLLGRQGADAPPGEFSTAARALRYRWKLVQWYAQQFWTRWRAEYVTLLHKRSKWHRRTNRKLQLNDVVLVVEPQKPRNQWKLGRVVGLHYSSDGEVRTVDVKTVSGVMKRPLMKLCLLETASRSLETV